MQSLNKRQEEKGERKGKRKEKEKEETIAYNCRHLNFPSISKKKYSIPCLKISQKVLGIEREANLNPVTIDLLAYK